MQQISVDERMAAHPEVVYDLVSDVTRMGEWSPETASCRWVGGAAKAEKGARFRGTNRHGWHRWTTTCTVTVAEPGRCFAFDVTYLGFPIATWSYEFSADGDACLVTETWTDRRAAWMDHFGPLATGVRDRAEQNRTSMTTTLARLREAAEKGS
jgi:hypothetical protein